MNEPPHPTVAVYRSLPQARVAHGAGSSRGLLEALARAGSQRALVITGPTVAQQTGLLAYIEQCLGPWNAGSFVDAGSPPNATSVAEALELFRAAEADALVSLGGGSAVDTAKWVAHALLEERSALPLHVAVPTTLPGAAFRHDATAVGEAGALRRALHPALIPREVFLDPMLTLETPPELWLSSGVAAFGHAIESLMGATHHPVTDALALEGARTLLHVLPRCATDPDAVEPRGRAQVAAWMAHFSPATTGSNLSDVLVRHVSATGVAHGIAACAVVPVVLRFLRSGSEERRVMVARQLGVSEPLDEVVARLDAEFGLPSRLRDTTIRREALSGVAERAWEEARAVSPVAVAGPAELRALLDEMW